MHQRSALMTFSSPVFLCYLSYCWNFIFISSCYMMTPDNGIDCYQAFTEPGPAQSREKMNSQPLVFCHLQVQGSLGDRFCGGC